MHRWYIYFENEDTGKRDFLGIITADTMSDALNLAAQYYEKDSGDLVAMQLT